MIAVGGFGIVYLARDHSLDRDVAVKEFMPAQLATRGEGHRVTARSTVGAETFALGLQSFIEEAKLLARFSHPSMVKVYSFWEANGTGYMVMPYLRGPTLGDVRRSMSQPPTEGWLRAMLDPLLDALAMLHAEGFYHRDIAPDNVLVSETGLPVLLDFGAARRLIGDSAQSVTVILKPRYAPIEQYAETPQLRQGPWTDLYALAAVVVFLLDGVPPPASTARSIHDEMAALGTRHIPGVSAVFLRAMDWALAVRPQDRPQSVAAWRDALDGRHASPSALRRRRVALWRKPVAASSARAADPFATTTRLAQGRASEATHQGFFPRRWKLALAGILAGTSIASLLLVLPPTDTVAAARDAATSLTTTAQVAPPPPVRVTPPPIVVEASAATEAAPAAAPSAVVLREPALGPVRVAHAAAARDATSQKPPGKTNTRTRKRATLAALPGPVELCASRIFFLRPFCVQRQCGEPRFRTHAQCAQQQPNRYARD
ncbi:MAG: serine/threonine-protein kinase [Burkholderiales bacterium]